MKKKNGYWTKIKCLEEGIKYESITKWRMESGGSYIAAYRNKWLDDCKNQMKPNGNKYKRLIYSFEFSDNFVYVGLTYNIKKRESQHLSSHNKSPVYNHMMKTKNKPNMKILSDYIDINLATEKELFYLNQYRDNNWSILNRIKTGGLGGNTMKNTKEACIINAKLYNSRSEWMKSSASIYTTACKNKWLDDCCAHMIPLKKPNGYWKKEHCLEDAKKYNSRSEWQLNSKNIYSIAQKNKWLDDCCAHMKYLHKKNGYWTKEQCMNDAKNYKSRNDWRINSSSASTIASKNKWLDDCCAHMK